MRLCSSLFLALIILGTTICSFAAESGEFVFQTDWLKYIVKSDGTVGGFIDKRDGSDLQDRSDNWFCTLQIARDKSDSFADHGVHADFNVHSDAAKTSLHSCKVEMKNGLYHISFTDGKKVSEVKAVLEIKCGKEAIVFRVVKVDGNFFSLTFARCLLKTQPLDDSLFGGTSMAMTLNVTMREFPGRSRTLGGIIYRKLGYQDAQMAVIGIPQARLRNAMKAIVSQIKKGEMPINVAGGPFALDDVRSRGNYIITSTAIKKNEVEAWCKHLSKFGINQIYFHQGNPFRHSDFVFNKSAYPDGISDFREVSQEFNKHGIITGILTYAHFVTFNSKFVTPVPHKDLMIMRRMTLNADIDAKQTSLAVLESTADISTITGFTITNSVVIRIGDELIKFGGANKTAPFGFTQCERGAFGTVASSHKKGSPVGQIMQKFNMFCSRPGSDLVREVAAETAKAYNEGGFSMIYLDALDGTRASSECPEYVPYYDAFFINEILKGVKRVPVMDYCFSWYPMSRVGEWDYARRGFQPYFDQHVTTLEKLADRYYLPGHMGWMALCPSKADTMSMLQCPPLFPEDVHYLGTKTFAWDYGLSYLDISLDNTAPLAFKNGEILNKYCLFQRKHSLTPDQLKLLKAPGKHFILESSASDMRDWYFRRADYSSSLSSLSKKTDGSAFTSFEVNNTFASQTPTIRIENRYTAGKPAQDTCIKLIDFDETKAPKAITTGKFEPVLNLKKQCAFGLWVYGDGKGQKINVRIDSPPQYVSGHNDHFIDVDFTGWRYFTLIEADNGTRKQENWPKSCGSYFDEYRELVHFAYVSEVNVMVIGPTDGLRFKTLYALPIETYNLENPTLACDDSKIVFQGVIPSGHYMEWTGGKDAAVCDHVGKEIGRVSVQGKLLLKPGVSRMTLQGKCDTTHVPHVRTVLGFKGPKI
ncbi:MAG: hypothetical protein PHQ75_08725 [Thermoguttaceae bacterium]|nr:hypothetical protein [Thermoguttaceae bacterium]